MQPECNILKNTVFAMVHSQQLVVVLLQKHFSSRCSTVFNPISTITNFGAHSGTVSAECATRWLRVRFQTVQLKSFIDII